MPLRFLRAIKCSLNNEQWFQLQCYQNSETLMPLMPNNVFDLDLEEPIFQLVSAGALDAIIPLVEAKPELVKLKEEKYLATPLIVAASYGQLDTVKWLIQEGGSLVNEGDYTQASALVFATAFGQIEI